MPKTVGITHIVPMPLIILTDLIALTIPIIHLGGNAVFEEIIEAPSLRVKTWGFLFFGL